ncbi:hypothetical protein Esti_005612 [Eimeria stiedai]
MTEQAASFELVGGIMMHPDDSEDHTLADLRAKASSLPGTPPRGVDGQAEPVGSHEPSVSDSPEAAASTADGMTNERKDRKDEDNSSESRSPRGRRSRGPPATVATRAVKRGVRGHATTRAGRGIGVSSRAPHLYGVRPPANRGSVAGDVHTVQEQASPGDKPSLSRDVTPNQSLEARRSTYFSICLNASPDELTVVSYNIRMESNSCCCFDDNWRRREAALSRYLLSLEEAHHPDVILVQGAYSTSTLRLLKRLDREEPMFPFQTRVVGGDPGCCRLSTEDGGCSCGSSCWYCLPFPARKPVKKGAAAAFVTNNGWDSVSGGFSRLRGNGGLVVLSKWPILRRHAYIFTKSGYPKSLTNAGAALVQVEKCGKVYNVLAMQLQPGVNQNAVRVAQVKEVMAWARSGMEDAEKVEFASFDIDGTFASSPDASTRPDSSEATSSVSENSQDGGLPKLGTRQGTSEKQKQQQTPRRRCAELPKGILKATDPLIIGGNLNFRFADDHASLAEALGPDGFRATLALEDASIAQPSFDTLNNDTCYQSQGCPEQPTQELLDYLLIYSDHAGRVARGQRTLVDPAPDKIHYRPVVLGCMPCNTVEVSHVSDFFPVCATFAHTSGA